jgi:signal transduction histidine kinase
VTVILIIILAVALIAAIGFAVGLYRDIRDMTSQLEFARRNATDVQLTTRTFFRRITALEAELNELFDEHRQAILVSRKTEAATRRALTNISHDLRTPLTSARGYLQLAEDAQTSEAQRAEYLRVVGERLNALTSLIDQLFEFTRLIEESGTPTEQPVQAEQLERLELTALLRDVLAAHYEELERAGLTVEASLSEGPTWVFASQEALRRVFANLISNAIAHGTGHLIVRLDASAAEVSFANHVPPEDLASLKVEHLFERFYTADLSRTNQSTGLGLAIVKTLAERMGARVSATLEGDLLEIRLSLRKDDAQ